MPAKSVALIFDDGYGDNYTNAFPILQKYQMRATFFIITGALGEPGYMADSQIRALSESGMEIQSHTVHHVSLGKINAGLTAKETADSKKTLEQILGKPCLFLAYPSGSFNTTVENNLKK